MGDIIRYCKKCGAELPTDYKYKKCEFCRHENAGAWRIIGEGLFLTASLAIAAGVAKFHHKSDNDADDENDNNENGNDKV